MTAAMKPFAHIRDLIGRAKAYNLDGGPHLAGMKIGW